MRAGNLSIMNWGLGAGRADEDFLLQLLNTTPVIDGVVLDQLGDAESGKAWLTARGRSGSVAEWRWARTARDCLQAVVREGASPAPLAGLLDRVARRPAVDADGLRWRLDIPTGRTAAVAAVLAWAELGRNSPGRLRACANDECQLFLIDRSKPNRARWCSMAVCGNRLKARRHYERVRHPATPLA
jgi:predicted RNA-binding Zn ribbon-like protein